VTFSIATTVDGALASIAAGATPIAGGTDLVVAARHGVRTLPDDLVAIDRVAELSRLEFGEDGVEIGAVVTHATLSTDPGVVDWYTALADASALVGSPATRHVGTIGGNVMNASPAMDTGAPLVVLSAEIELRSMSSVRTLPIADLWTGPGSTVARPDELCTSIRMPSRTARSGSAYVRLEYRRAMEIAVVGAAASVTIAGDGSIADLAVALTAVAPTIVTVDVDDMVGRGADEVTNRIAGAASAQATPISDVRASDRYRRHTVGVVARRAVHAAVRRAHGESIAVPVNRHVGIGAAS
jgi:CO/xanthine dehydrogenase FAD-binding subunit